MSVCISSTFTGAPSKVESDTQSIDTPNDVDNPPETSDAPIEVVDADDESKSSILPSHAETAPTQPPPAAQLYPGGYSIDVAFEASKLPLDVAIFNSARAAGGDEKIRKYLQAVLVIGGTALIPGMAHALESRGAVLFVSRVCGYLCVTRLQAIATPLVPNMEKVTIIPPPKEVDPRVLAWKGAAVLAKMDGVSELWVTASDWVRQLPCNTQYLYAE